MAGIKILGTGMYVPEFIVDNNDFAEIVETSDEWIRERTGMNRRHVSLGEPTWYMGAKAATQAMEAAGVSAEAIDMIIVTTVTPDCHFPSVACMIQREVGAHNAFAFDISVACAGLAFSLDMARRYLSTGDVNTILLVGSENLTQFLDYTDRSSCILFADGAGACVVQKSDLPFASYLHTDASGVDATYNKRKRKSLPFSRIPTDSPTDLYPHGVEDAIYMNGREVYKFATKAMPHALLEACAKLDMTPKDLDLIIPHQANQRILETASKNLGIPMDKIYCNIAEYSNTSSASILIGLDECIRNGRLKRGDKVAIVGFGAGLTLGANVFEY